MAHEGQLTIVVSAVPEDTSALADRLGRYLPTDVEPISQDIGEGVKGRAARRARAEREAERARIAARDEERARQRWGVTLGGVDLSEARLDRRTRAGSSSATPAASCSPAPSRTPSTRTAASTATRPRTPCASPTPRTSTTPCPAAGRASSTSAVVACPAASASGSCWPARSRPRPRCWCWSSPRPPSTPTPRRGSPSGWPTSAVAGRPWSPPCRRCGCTTPTGSCWCRTTRPSPTGTHEDLLLDSPDYRRVVTRAMDFDGQPAESPAEDRPCAVLTPRLGRWMTVADLLATSPDTWRDRASEPPVIPQRADPAERGLVHRPGPGPAAPARPARAPGAGELRPVAQARARLAGGRQPCGAGVLPYPPARASAGSSSCWSCSTAWPPRPVSSFRACSAR